jgi:hypothetical protein
VRPSRAVPPGRPALTADTEAGALALFEAADAAGALD